VAIEQFSVRGLPPRAVEVMRLRGVQRPADAGAALNVVLKTPQGKRSLACPVW
jgi:hypothetical protein